MAYDFDKLTDKELEDELKIVDDRRIFCIAEALRRGISLSLIHI